MMKSVWKALALVCALCVATPLIAAEGGKGQGKGKAGARPDPMGAALAGLGLSDEQKSKIADIRKKYAPEFKEFETANKDALKAARESGDKAKMAEIMKPMMEKRKAMMGEIKGVLNDEQKTKLDEAMAKAAAGQQGKGKKK
jgi:Spy/CpxP family protein refolding chaperone